MNSTDSQAGPLTGKTILRFAHAFETGGGTERYLDDLDRALLTRNAMTIVRLHLTRNQCPAGPTEESIGQGTLVCVPLPILLGSESASGTDEHSFRFQLREFVRNWVLYNPLVWLLIGAKKTTSLRLLHKPGQAAGAGKAASAAFRSRSIDLTMLHFFGGADAEDVLSEARKAGVPVALLNHFSNDRFLHLSIRKHTLLANGVAGVNGLGLPRYVRNGFTNLSDGIDTEFFRRENARALKNPPPNQVILLPARVIREKGQLDLVRAVASLRKSGLNCDVAFAGRVDSSGFIDELKHGIANAGMTECVHFLGILNLEELRDWYAASSIVALPTYHHEGLPRIVLEAQAMAVPIVAYASGGLADGILEGQTGYLLKPGDLSGLTRRLRELLESPSLRETMGRRGRQEAETRFSLAALTDRHERFYLKVISDFKSSATG